jgi:hypothetical protein
VLDDSPNPLRNEGSIMYTSAGLQGDAKRFAGTSVTTSDAAAH